MATKPNLKNVNRAACDAEIANINNAIVLLNNAKHAATEHAFTEKMGAAFRIIRNIVRERL